MRTKTGGIGNCRPFCVKSFGKKWEDNKSRKDRSRRKWSDFERFLPCFGAKSPYFIGFLIFAKTLVSRAFCLKISRERSRIGSNPITRTMQIRTGTIRLGPYFLLLFSADPPQHGRNAAHKTARGRRPAAIASASDRCAGSLQVPLGSLRVPCRSTADHARSAATVRS